MIKQILQNLDKDSGALLKAGSCGLHPNSYDLILQNQGGYDATEACLECCNELRTALQSGRERTIFASQVNLSTDYNERNGKTGPLRLELIEQLLKEK